MVGLPPRLESALTGAHVDAARDALSGLGAETQSGDWLAAGEAADLLFDALDPDQADAAIRRALGEAPIDCVTQPLAGRRKRLLVADMESTLIHQEMLDELADLKGLRPAIAAVTARAMNGEIDFVGALKERVMRDRYRPAPDEEGFERWREIYCTDAYFQRIIDDPNCMLLCIGSLRDPVGMAVLRRTGTHLEIDDLLVLRPRMGDGRRLLVAALRYAEAWRINDVHIDVYPGNEKAEAFLRSHGFHLERESENDIGRPMLRFERAID